MSERMFESVDQIPQGNADRNIIPGCMVLEGGAWRGLYTQGALDFLMQKGVNMQTTIGVSAGALAGMNYVSGQIGRSARINLAYRHNQNYVGLGALAHDHGITGFSYLFGDISKEYPLDEERFNDPDRRFVCVTTNIDTGKAEYFERGKCSDIYKAVQASATVPYVSEPVEIDGQFYLDGGIGDKIPFRWAMEEGFEKIIVIRTRDESFRKKITRPLRLTEVEYRRYPEFARALEENGPRYNISLDFLDALHEKGQLFVLTPSRPISISRFEGDLDALYEVYEMGRQDAEEHFEELMEYLSK